MSAVPSAPSVTTSVTPVTGKTAGKTTGSDQQIKGFLENIRTYILLPFDEQVLNTVPEIGHLAPVILTLGVAFISVVTLNYPLAILSASTFEASLLYNVFQMASAFVETPSGLQTPSGPQKPTDKCSSSFQTLTPSRFKYFISQTNNFPISPLYYITFAATYCIQSMLFFNKETSELGPQYSNRPYLALLGGALFIVLYSIYLLAYGCNSITSIVVTIVLAALVGYLISYQNYLLFGKSSVDLMFIPPLARREGLDYICVASKK
jgi:hypothetical protein